MAKKIKPATKKGTMPKSLYKKGGAVKNTQVKSPQVQGCGCPFGMQIGPNNIL